MQAKILTIYLKEMKEILRDRKTLIFMVLLPTLIVPVLMSVTVRFAQKAEKKARTETLRFAVFGAEHLPEIADAFDSDKGFEKVHIAAPEDIESAVSQDKIKFALVIPDFARRQLEIGGQVAVKLYYDNAAPAARVRQRASKVIERVSEQWRSTRLNALGVADASDQEHLLNPLTIDEHGTATVRQVVGAHAGGLLPYMFIILCFVGAAYSAIDIAAGEKERGTLETLLLAPIPRRQIVLGKFFVVFTTGITAALLNLSSLGLMLFVKGARSEPVLREIARTINIADLVLVAAMLIPTAAIFAALLLSVSIYAKSYKEASAYTGPLNFLVILPAFVALMPWVQLNWFWAMVPISNVSLAVKELVKGTMNYWMLAAILGSTFVIAGALLLFCTRWFERETVLFRS